MTKDTVMQGIILLLHCSITQSLLQLTTMRENNNYNYYYHDDDYDDDTHT